MVCAKGEKKEKEGGNREDEYVLKGRLLLEKEREG